LSVDDVLERWLEAVVSTPGMTGLTGLEDARRALLDDALRGRELVSGLPGAVVDVGSGGGSPGVPLAASLPDRSFTLLDAERRKCAFLEEVTSGLENIKVVWGRAEDQSPDSFGVAVAKALAKPAVATELCLPLVEPGGAAILWLGESADLEAVATVASRLGGELGDVASGLAVVHKLRPTPAGFPRRAGMAKKRPLA
jgi:16S rRNA (guanine527-N7)-methyltransferase